jgi:hypothetical protein
MSTSGASSSANTSDHTAVESPSTPEANMLPDVEDKQTSSAYTTPIDTAVSNSVADRSTPRAQTRQDFEEDLRRRSVRKSVNLAGMSP